MEEKEAKKTKRQTSKKVATVGVGPVVTPHIIQVETPEEGVYTFSNNYPLKNHKIDPEAKQTIAPKPKRFENHTLVFMYFLKMINYDLLWDKKIPRNNVLSLHRNYTYRSQRRWLLDIAQSTLTRARWVELMEGEYDLVTDETVLPDNTNTVCRIDFTDEEYQEVISWELVDFHVRQILAKKSFLSRNKRDFLLGVFSWVDNFVAKEGEEVTMGVDDITNIQSTEDILKRAFEIIKDKEEKEPESLKEVAEKYLK